MKILLFILLLNFISCYKIIIVPGMGGSKLYNLKKKVIWPSFNLNELNIESTNNEFIIPIANSVGDINNIRIDNPITYLLTKNIYYNSMIDFLLSEKHLLYSFSYDFRYILFNEYYTTLYDNFSNFFKDSDDNKYIVICHSLGGLVFKHYLSQHEEIKKYIEKIYFINVPWGGTPLSFYLIYDIIMKEENLQSSKLINIIKRKIYTLHLFSGFYMTLPLTDDVFLKKNGILFDKMEYRFFFEKNPMIKKKFNLFEKYSSTRFDFIDIPHNIVFSYGIDTLVFIDYDSKSLHYADGDGIIPLKSLLYQQKNGSKCNIISVKNVEHSKINSYLPMLKMCSQNKNELIF